jgi:hypothetical protein
MRIDGYLPIHDYAAIADSITRRRSPIIACSPRAARSATYDNVLPESFVDSIKTKLNADRIWCSRSQLELAVVEYIAW